MLFFPRTLVLGMEETMRRLSSKQEKILSYLKEFVSEKGYPPSIREIGKACGISSTSVVKYNLNILQREGYIRRDPEVSRGIDLASASAASPTVNGPAPRPPPA